MSAQSTHRVLMVRPACFGFNEETAQSNAWQRPDDQLDTAERAAAEHDQLVSALRAAGVEVCVLEDDPEPPQPDAVFPNNWISFHADGTVVVYPMKDPSRRRERRLQDALQATGVRPARVLDLSAEEAQGRFLEGTGSLVLDHQARVAWACRSPRTHPELARRWAEAMGYTLELFDAVDPRGGAAYHTNVILAIGTHFAILGSFNVVEADRARVIARLAETGREVVQVGPEAIGAFAGNVLELRGSAGTLLACSSSAWEVLARHQERLQVDAVVAVPVPTIERVGGGSVRCMIAEVWC